MTDIQKVALVAAGLAVLGGGFVWANYTPPFEQSEQAKAQWADMVRDCNADVAAWDRGEKGSLTVEHIGDCRAVVAQDAKQTAKSAP